MAEATDAFGRALADWARGGTDPEILERDDGHTEVGAGHELYVAGPECWPGAERRSLRYARGRVIDLGCGAGRVALHLQRRGLDVVAADASPLAVRTTRARGVREVRRLSAGGLTDELASFDTVVLFGNNFGLFGTPGSLRRTLAVWARRARPGTRILAESTSPFGGGVPALSAEYIRRNRRRDKMAGQIRLRVHYRRWTGPWFGWLFVSPAQMRKLLRGTGWRPMRLEEGDRGDPYVAVLERTDDGGRTSPRRSPP